MTASLRIDDILAALGGLDAKTRDETIATAQSLVEGMRWIPNPGAQSEGFFCEADELFYGGQAGGGKSALAVGLAVNCHTRSLLLRRTNKEALGLVEYMAEVIGDRDGWSGQQGIWRLGGDRTVEINGCQLEDDKQKFKGVPHDLICFDEVSDFSESQYVFITTWNRSAKPGQRCRVVATGNPPTRPEGLWVLKRWAAWLDPNHPNPAKPGELRWYTAGEDGKEIEVDGPGPHLIGGEEIVARSRTFIPAKLSDNPDLEASGYASVLAALPEELRAAYRDGKFDAGLKDSAYQAIPTAWVRLAQARWEEMGGRPPSGVPMCAIGVDASGGGRDPMVMAPRYDGFYDKLIVVEGKEIPIERAGRFCAGLIVSHRRDGAKVVLDLGGGYGSSTYEQLRENDIDVVGYKGAEAGYGKDKSGRFGFANKRSASIWRFREALDPDQPGGSPIMLPPSQSLLADLTAPTYYPDSKTIEIESKEAVCKRLGRSTNEGDAVIMSWTAGAKNATVPGGMVAAMKRRVPQVVMGHAGVARRK